MHHQHDKAYKRFFSHREPVEDLLRAYVQGDWLHLLDLSTLERAPTETISEASHRRHNDIIWRVRWQHKDLGEWLYIYLFLEFQSSPAPDMVLRLAEYIALFYRDLIKAKNVPTGTKLQLPPVIPIVLYNGRLPWVGSTSLSELICTPEELAHLQLSLRFILLDEARINTDHTEEHNLITLLFRLEQSQNPKDLIAVTEAFIEVLRSKKYSSLAAALDALVRESLVGRLPDLQIPDTLTFQEVPHMIGENMAAWGQAQRAEAMAQGLAQGKAEGETHGLITMLRLLLENGTIQVDEARAQLEALMANGQIPIAAGQDALARLG